MKRFLVTGLFLAVLLRVWAAEPVLPRGFSWEELPGLAARIPKAPQWKVQHERKEGAEIYRLTGPVGGGTSASLQLNGVREVQRKTGMVPTEYAKKLTEAAGEGQRLRNQSVGRRGPYQFIAFRFEDNSPGRKGTMMHYEFLADDTQDRLIVLAFEAPVKGWAESWKTGKVLVEQMQFDAPASKPAGSTR